jgi:hypothetical protein
MGRNDEKDKRKQLTRWLARCHEAAIYCQDIAIRLPIDCREAAGMLPANCRIVALTLPKAAERLPESCQSFV